MRTISVEKLFKDTFEELDLRFYSGKSGKTRQITTPKIQKSGLLFAGIFRSFHPNRIQIVGEAEMIFFEGLDPKKGQEVLDQLFCSDLPCIIFTGGVKPPQGIKKMASQFRLPVFVSGHETSTVIEKVINYLSVQLAERTSIHGVLMDIYGIGVLITGPSGIGKSECALDLINKGHRFVADDVIEIEKRGHKTLLGMGADLIKPYMEIRGLGIINIKDLFGLSSIIESKRVDLVIELEEWDSDKKYDRTGITERYRDLLNVKLPSVVFPVSPGRDLSTLVEVAVRNHLVKQTGVYSAVEFDEKHRASIKRKDSKRD
jgi:HPr kinase/phosphorylase